MNRYREAVEYYASKGENYVLFNSGDEHASIIFENIFRTAKEEINIHAYDLCNDLTSKDGYLNSLESFLKEDNTKLNILLSTYNYECAKNSKLFILLRRFHDKVNLYHLNGAEIKVKEEVVHFCIADNKMYRYEFDVTNRKARCNFNEPEMSQRLKSLFYMKIKSSTRVELN